MATNPPAGDGHRNGAVKKRSQVYNPKTEQWVKRDKNTGRFMDVKQDGTPFKGVRKKSDLMRTSIYTCPHFILRALLHCLYH